jgi:2-keto-3-deoxy-L-rhamnonate aldolase RhmA
MARSAGQIKAVDTARTMREMVATRELKVGHFICEFATPGIGQLLKAAGCDFALLDCEHSGFGFETVKSVLRYMQAADLPTIVRVPSREYHHIARACDMGAEGLMLPMVSDAREAEQIVQSMKYYPRGGRGVALGIAHDRYLPGPVLEKLEQANQRTTLFAQIETAAGVKNADEIAAVDGVDCLWVGHFDLSSSLGIPGEFGHRKFTDAIERVRQACGKHGKAYGRLVPTVEDGIALHKGGFDFICYSGDVWAYLGAISSAVQAIRDGAKCGAAATGIRDQEVKGKAGKGKGSRKKAK